ncbi:MAG: hypothetical protein Q7S21_01895 [archaeon]|nr:hypothetical protein [archaeon]
MKKAILALIFLSILVFGCVQQQTQNIANNQIIDDLIPEPQIVPANINFLNTTTTAKVNAPVKFDWRVVGGEIGKIDVTALRWDTIPQPVDFRTYSNAGKSFTGNSPQEFSDSLTFDIPGTYYVRGHAIVDGKNVYTEEIEVTILTVEIIDENVPDFPVDENQFEPPSQIVRKYSITVDDSKFDPVEVNAKAGEIVELTITCAEQNVYFAGARVESEYFNTGAIAVGESKTVSFTMPSKDVKMTNYWPETNVKKADGWIKLEQ